VRRLGLYVLSFALFGVLELTLLVWLATRVGVLATLAFVMVSAAIGIYAGRAQGLSVYRRWRDATDAGELAEEGLVDGLLVLAGAAMWLLPGVLSDLLGAALFIPPLRRALSARIRQRAAGWVQSGDVQVMTFSSVGVDPRGFDPRGFDPRDEVPSVFARGDVIDTVGEVVEEPQRERLLPPLSIVNPPAPSLSPATPRRARSRRRRCEMASRGTRTPPRAAGRPGRRARRSS
jgi:UPF0716 protein FxsA